MECICFFFSFHLFLRILSIKHVMTNRVFLFFLQYIQLSLVHMFYNSQICLGRHECLGTSLRTQMIHHALMAAYSLTPPNMMNTLIDIYLYKIRVVVVGALSNQRNLPIWHSNLPIHHCLVLPTYSIYTRG